jgi:hypothetical protein
MAEKSAASPAVLTIAKALTVFANDCVENSCKRGTAHGIAVRKKSKTCRDKVQGAI